MPVHSDSSLSLCVFKEKDAPLLRMERVYHFPWREREGGSERPSCFCSFLKFLQLQHAKLTYFGGSAS